MPGHKDYQRTVEHLLLEYPMFQQVGEQAMKPGLDNIHRLARGLESPHARFPSIHIAGTNGKGSTGHILAAILQQKGLRVGLYTTPHYKDMRERVKVNGEHMPEAFVVDFAERNSGLLKRVGPSFFELTTIMAFSYFAEQGVDIAIVEAGMGGANDATNIITPILSIITNVGMDHAHLLGGSLRSIAEEKGGIIKGNIPVVVSERQADTDGLFIKRAEHRSSPIHFARDTYTVLPTIRALTHAIYNVYKNGRLFIRDLESDLAGRFQADNLAGVMKVVDLLNAKGYRIGKNDVMTALGSVRRSTGFMGRMQVLDRRPLVLVDSGHNEEALSRVLSELAAKGLPGWHFVLGFTQGRDLGRILRLFPKDAAYYFCAPDLPRAVPVEDLAVAAAEAGLEGHAYATVKAALHAAKNKAAHREGILVGGSGFIVAEVV